MHQRIRELVVEAGFYANPDVEKFEKFAQLIVQECAGIAHANADADKTYDYACMHACHTIAWKIQEHFGVK